MDTSPTLSTKSLLILGAVLILNLLVLYCLLSDFPWIQERLHLSSLEPGDRLTLFESLILLETLLALVWYTMETWKIRCSSEATLAEQRAELERIRRPSFALSFVPQVYGHSIKLKATNVGATASRAVAYNLSFDGQEIGTSKTPLLSTEEWSFSLPFNIAVNTKNIIQILSVDGDGSIHESFFLYEFVPQEKGDDEHQVRRLPNDDELITKALDGEFRLT